MVRQLKVLHIIGTLSVGGAERLILGLAQQIDHRRFDIHVCSLSVVRGNALRSDFEQLDRAPFVIGAKRFYSLPTILAVAHYIRRHQIDIIHTHLVQADIIGSLVGQLLGKPIVTTLHNEPRDYNRNRLDLRWLERFSTRFLSKRLIAVSKRIEAMFIADWHIPANRISTIYNAVPHEQEYMALSEQPQRIDNDGPVITSIGRLSPQKGQHHLLVAAKRVLRQRPTTRFMIVGQGRLEQSLKEQAQALGIADRIMFTGLRHDIPTVLAQTDIFVLPSLWEGMPLTVIEAMAAARPVVVTDVGGCRELVEPGTHGPIVPPGDEEALADALLSLLDDAPRRQEMGRAARKRVQQEFSVATLAARHEMLYEDLWRDHYATTSKPHVSTKS